MCCRRALDPCNICEVHVFFFIVYVLSVPCSYLGTYVTFKPSGAVTRDKFINIHTLINILIYLLVTNFIHENWLPFHWLLVIDVFFVKCTSSEVGSGI